MFNNEIIQSEVERFLARHHNIEERAILVYKLSLCGIEVPKKYAKHAIDHFFKDNTINNRKPEQPVITSDLENGIVVAIHQGMPGKGIKYALASGKYGMAIKHLREAGLHEHSYAVALIASEILEKSHASLDKYLRASNYASQAGPGFEAREKFLQLIHATLN
jgi:hypothetical protein